MKIVKFLLLLIAALVIVIILAGFLLSGEYSAERSITIDASPEQVHYYVGDLANWDQWTPWNEMDPSIVTTLGEKSSGVGASQTWTGKDGRGELTFTRCDSGGIEYDMAFIQGDNRWPAQCAMLYSPEGDSTTVRWTMSGKMENFMGRYLAVMMPSWITRDFDKGLEKLKAKAEALPPVLEEPAPAEEADQAAEEAAAG